ncbi:transforming acidic coiled-coil containing protein [Sesbania bispinosa]|nr:transforming acidic coiled-coil containing protein [Sesbania bispinosa]
MAYITVHDPCVFPSGQPQQTTIVQLAASPLLLALIEGVEEVDVPPGAITAAKMPCAPLRHGFLPLCYRSPSPVHRAAKSTITSHDLPHPLC